VDITPWPTMLELLDYWQDWPPVHILVAQFVGHKPRNAGIKNASEEELKRFLKDFKSGKRI